MRVLANEQRLFARDILAHARQHPSAPRASLRAAASRKRTQRCLLTNPEASAAMLASRRSERQAAQPTAEKFAELADFGTIRSRSANEMKAYDS